VVPRSHIIQRHFGVNLLFGKLGRSNNYTQFFIGSLKWPDLQKVSKFTSKFIHCLCAIIYLNFLEEIYALIILGLFGTHSIDDILHNILSVIMLSVVAPGTHV
jgi:hypothetical protein